MIFYVSRLGTLSCFVRLAARFKISQVCSHLEFLDLCLVEHGEHIGRGSLGPLAAIHSLARGHLCCCCCCFWLPDVGLQIKY